MFSTEKKDTIFIGSSTYINKKSDYFCNPFKIINIVQLLLD
jgi:hypothetical protein